jgi:hypothetical protein
MEASARAAIKLDDLALGLDAPTWPLATLRVRPQRVLRAFRPGETPAPKGSPVRHLTCGTPSAERGMRMRS